MESSQGHIPYAGNIAHANSGKQFPTYIYIYNIIGTKKLTVLGFFFGGGVIFLNFDLSHTST